MIDQWLEKTYDWDAYNCSHFVSEVWADLTGDDISLIARGVGQGSLSHFKKEISKRERLRQPEDPCVVLLHLTNQQLHAGVYVEGKVLHLTENGVIHQDLNQLSSLAKRVTFYR